MFWLRKAAALNNGEATVELARLCVDSGRYKLAADLLKRAQRLSMDDISQAAMEEARNLLQQMNKTKP